MRRRPVFLVLFAVVIQCAVPCALHAAIAAPPETVWVGNSFPSADPFCVGVGGRWTFEPPASDSAQGWTFLQAPSSNDADVFPTPGQRPWWYLDYGNSVNGIRRAGTRPLGVVGVWHPDGMSGVSVPILGARSAWCGLRRPGDLTAIDPVTQSPLNGDIQPGGLTGSGVQSGWPGYADQWDQILYRDFPTTGAPIALGFDMRVRLSTLVPGAPGDPGGSGWFSPDPTSPGNLELNQPDRFRVWVGVPYTGQVWDTNRRWLSEVINFSVGGPGAPTMLYQTTGFDPPLAAGPAASTPVGLVIPDYSAVSPTVRVAFQVKTNRTDSDFRTGPGGFNSTDGAVVLDNVAVGPSMSTFDAANSIVARSSAFSTSVVWITTGKPAAGYGHVDELSHLLFSPLNPCGLAGLVMTQTDHEDGEIPIPNSNNWALSPVIGLSGTRAAAQGIPATLRDEIVDVVVEFDYYGGPVDPNDPELFFSFALRHRGTGHLSLLQPVSPQVPAWTSFQSPAQAVSLGGDSCRFVLRGNVTGFVPWSLIDSIQVALQSWVRCGPGASALCSQTYGGHFDNIRVGFVKGTPAPISAGLEFPITFSVDGPVDPNTEGLRDPRGAPSSPQAPVQAGNPTGFGIRNPPVPAATGIDGPPPGDVFGYRAESVPADAVVFQSGPPTPGSPQGSGPDGTNSQVIEPEGAGMVAGTGLGSTLWHLLPPDAPARDNIDALSFGTDYFPPGITVGPDPNSVLPPAAAVAGIPWSGRDAAAVPPYAEPMVISDGPGAVFHFSVDPWATGMPGTAVSVESGGSDAGAGLGPWSSPGRAAGIVFESNLLTRVGGITLGGGANAALIPNPAIGLAPITPPLAPIEDDVDALESRGTNVDWLTGDQYWPGNVHSRVIELGVDPPPVDSSWHVPRHSAPVFFSVTRNSAGAEFTAVRSQFVVNGGAAGDIFVMAKDPLDPADVGTNLLFIDDAEIGLYSSDASPGGTSPDDYTDDLDGLILNVCPEFRAQVVEAIDAIIAYHGTAFAPWALYGFGGAFTGAGMTVSITKLLYPDIPPGCIQVGFSVTTDAIGFTNTAVDWEAGPVDPIGGPSTAAGDIFYAQVSGAAVGTNYLWHDEAALGLDPGTWVNGTSTNLLVLGDNLDALDTDSLFVAVADVDPSGDVPSQGRLQLRSWPNPSASRTNIALAVPSAGRVRVRVLDVSGRVVAQLADRWQPVGTLRFTWDGSNASGARVGPGIFFVVVDAAGVRKTVKILRLR